MPSFDLIIQYGRPVAAIIPERLPAAQLKIIYSLLDPAAVFQPKIADRWNASIVLSTREWASEQLGRVPMLPPKGIHLAFVNPAETSLRPVQMDAAARIIHVVCNYFGVRPSDLESSSRRASVVWPRFFAMGLIREFTKMPTEKIGLLFGRDHSSVLHGLRALKDRIETSPGEADVYRLLQEQLNLAISPASQTA